MELRLDSNILFYGENDDRNYELYDIFAVKRGPHIRLKVGKWSFKFYSEYFFISFPEVFASIYIYVKSLSDGLFDKRMTSQSELCFVMVVCDVSFKEKGIKILL